MIKNLESSVNNTASSDQFFNIHTDTLLSFNPAKELKKSPKRKMTKILFLPNSESQFRLIIGLILSLIFSLSIIVFIFLSLNAIFTNHINLPYGIVDNNRYIRHKNPRRYDKKNSKTNERR